MVSVDISLVLMGVIGGGRLDGNTVCPEGGGVDVALEASEVGVNAGFNVIGVRPPVAVVIWDTTSVVLIGVTGGGELGGVAVCHGGIGPSVPFGAYAVG